jgi:hypothetical protein
MVDVLKIGRGSASDTLTAKVARELGTKSLKLEIKCQCCSTDRRIDQEGRV